MFVFCYDDTPSNPSGESWTLMLPQTLLDRIFHHAKSQFQSLKVRKILCLCTSACHIFIRVKNIHRSLRFVSAKEERWDSTTIEVQVIFFFQRVNELNYTCFIHLPGDMFLWQSYKVISTWRRIAMFKRYFIFRSWITTGIFYVNCHIFSECEVDS